jgi:hypothetical protein
MILTAIKPVNARLGKPSTNASNPGFLLPGEKIKVVNRVLGDSVFGNTEWVVTEENELYSAEGFHRTEEFKTIPFFAHIQNIPKVFQDMQIARLWNISRGEEINIGVIDNGVSKHPAIKGKIQELNTGVPANDDLNNHATTMACIIGALDEDHGKIGIAPMVANIFSYKIDIKNLGPIDLITALDAMQKAKVHVLNMSFSTDKSIFFTPNIDAVNLQKKINSLTDSGCVIVCATGNDHGRIPEFHPAKYENVISVAGIDAGGNLDFNSNLWNGVSISLSSQHYFTDSQHELSNGTSSATAIVSGCIACVYRSLKGSNKTQAVKKIFSEFTPLKHISELNQHEISIPQFNTQRFIQSIK